jgi:hypothetical protein
MPASWLAARASPARPEASPSTAAGRRAKTVCVNRLVAVLLRLARQRANAVAEWWCVPRKRRLQPKLRQCQQCMAGHRPGRHGSLAQLPPGTCRAAGVPGGSLAATASIRPRKCPGRRFGPGADFPLMQPPTFPTAGRADIAAPRAAPCLLAAVPRRATVKVSAGAQPNGPRAHLRFFAQGARWHAAGGFPGGAAGYLRKFFGCAAVLLGLSGDVSLGPVCALRAEGGGTAGALCGFAARHRQWFSAYTKAVHGGG